MPIPTIQLNVRLDQGTYAALARLAEKNGISVTAAVKAAIVTSLNIPLATRSSAAPLPTEKE